MHVNDDARFATSRPIRPSPMIPSVFSLSSNAHELGSLPFSGLHGCICLGNIPAEREHHGHRMLSCRKGISLRCMATMIPRRVAAFISILSTQPRHTDKFQPLSCLDDPLGYLGSGSYEQCVIILDRCNQFILRKPVFTSTMACSRRISIPSSASSSLTRIV
jgi:hypothetical protein